MPSGSDLSVNFLRLESGISTRFFIEASPPVADLLSSRARLPVVPVLPAVVPERVPALAALAALVPETPLSSARPFCPGEPFWPCRPLRPLTPFWPGVRFRRAEPVWPRAAFCTARTLWLCDAVRLPRLEAPVLVPDLAPAAVAAALPLAAVLAVAVSAAVAASGAVAFAGLAGTTARGSAAPALVLALGEGSTEEGGTGVDLSV